jgi:hypothetical protein
MRVMQGSIQARVSNYEQPLLCAPFSNTASCLYGLFSIWTRAIPNELVLRWLTESTLFEEESSYGMEFFAETCRIRKCIKMDEIY